ncbi:MAG: rRNA maturation RNase YbeY [Candidatus Uhrbacteria bacterium]|nr:rRNA maturation RNase YbeY [Candidatus Uhrbacteria bacterium]
MISLEFIQDLAPFNERLSEALVESLKTEINKQIPNIPEEGEVTVKFVTDEEIKKLNNKYRKKDEVTDVLSFTYGQDGPPGEAIGDVVISLEQARRQKGDKSLVLELADLATHGILHVLGYDHETEADANEMLPLQDLIVEKIL